MKQFFQNIQKQIAQTEQFRYIGQDWGQLSAYQNAPPVGFPCCLVDVQSVEYSNLSADFSKTPRQRQMAQVQVIFSVADMQLTPNSWQTHQKQKDPSFQIWSLLESLHQKMHYFSPLPNATPLQRQSLEKIIRDDGVLQYQLIYSCQIQGV